MFKEYFIHFTEISMAYPKLGNMGDDIGSGSVRDCLLRLFWGSQTTYSAMQSCTTAKIKTNRTGTDVIAH